MISQTLLSIFSLLSTAHWDLPNSRPRSATRTKLNQGILKKTAATIYMRIPRKIVIVK